MPQTTISGGFFYKASHAQGLMEDNTAQPIRAEVIKMTQLSARQFQHLSANLLRDIGSLNLNQVPMEPYHKPRTRPER